MGLCLVTRGEILVVLPMHTLVHITGRDSDLSLFSYSGYVVEDEFFASSLILPDLNSYLMSRRHDSKCIDCWTMDRLVSWHRRSSEENDQAARLHRPQ